MENRSIIAYISFECYVKCSNVFFSSEFQKVFISRAEEAGCSGVAHEACLLQLAALTPPEMCECCSLPVAPSIQKRRTALSISWVWLFHGIKKEFLLYLKCKLEIVNHASSSEIYAIKL